MRINKDNAKQFLLHTGIRATKTFFQTFVASIGISATMAQVDWKVVLSTSLLSAIISIGTSFATGLPEVTPTLESEDKEDGNL